MTSTASAIKFLSSFVRNKISRFEGLAEEVYRPAVARGKKQLQISLEDVTQRAFKSELVRKARIAKEYFKVEMAPPSRNEVQLILNDFKLLVSFFKQKCYMDMTVRQAFLFILVGLEISMWFYFGETVGKMKIIGYRV